MARVAALDLVAVGHVGHRLGQRQLTLRQADEFRRLQGGGSDQQRPRVGVANVFRGADDHAASDETRILAGLQHPRQPVDGSVGVAAAHALDEGAGNVVMGVAAAVVVEGLALNRVLSGLRVMVGGCSTADSTATSSAFSARRASPSLTSARKSAASGVSVAAYCPRPRSVSARARCSSVLMALRVSGSKVKI